MIFSLLSGRQITKACQVARENKEYRLGFLLAQAGGDHHLKHYLRSQLSQWDENHVSYLSSYLSFFKRDSSAQYATSCHLVLSSIIIIDTSFFKFIQWFKCWLWILITYQVFVINNTSQYFTIGALFWCVFSHLIYFFIKVYQVFLFYHFSFRWIILWRKID